jgi:hypothetical protein
MAMSSRFKVVSMVAICGAALLAQHAIARETAATVLPQVKALHLRVIALTADVPKACRVFAGAFGGQFADGPYANLVIMSVSSGAKGCIFHGIYGWSAYAKDPKPGTTDVGPGSYLETTMVGGDLKLGDPGSTGMIIHPDLRAEYYSQGSMISRASLQRIPAAELN